MYKMNEKQVGNVRKDESTSRECNKERSRRQLIDNNISAEESREHSIALNDILANTLSLEDEARACSTVLLCCATSAFRFDHSRPCLAKYVCEVAGVSSLTFSFVVRC